jgi:hypothetical protein
MKIIKGAILVLLMSLVTMADTEDLGNHVFSNDMEYINLVADAAVAARNSDSPYLMIVLYMYVDGDIDATVQRKDVVMVYEDKEYPMPSVKELRKNYRGDTRDIRLYNSVTKATLALSPIRHYRFPLFQDFFPSKTSAVLAVDQGSMTSYVGFRTRVYFKNPGIKDGDVIVIKVKDNKDPEVYGSVAVEFKKK